jgi:hypothetical protein
MTKLACRRRTIADIDTKNGLRSRYPGGKLYGTPEYCPNFFKTGGMVVGSTHTTQARTTSRLSAPSDFENVISYASMSPTRQLWAGREQSESLAREIAEVDALPKYGPTAPPS